MSSIYDCTHKKRQELKTSSNIIEIQNRLLDRIDDYMSKLSELDNRKLSENGKKLEACELHLYSDHDLFDILYIHPKNESLFDTELKEWPFYQLTKDEKCYFSLLDLINSSGFLAAIAPLTLYAEPAPEKGNIR